MQVDQFLVIFYILFWVVRINGCIRRGRQPLLRGREWFFTVHVRSDFYTSAGKRILHRYWLRMLIPFLLDIPLAVAIFLSGHLALLNWLVIGLSAVIHINHCYSVDLAERQAQAFAVPEASQPVASMVLSMKPRRLWDYSNPKLEWMLAVSTLAAFAWLIRSYFAAPEPRDLRLVFGTPVFLLYIQLGLLFVKRLILAWRTPIPQAQAEEHLRVREETRKFYLKMCDWNRVLASAGIVFWPIQTSASPEAADRLTGIWLAAWLVVSVVGTILVEIKRKKLAALSLRAQPVKLPDFLRQSEIARWPVCYQPSVPMLLLKGARGYSLNLANTLAYVGAAYLAGWVALVTLLPKGR